MRFGIPEDGKGDLHRPLRQISDATVRDSAQRPHDLRGVDLGNGTLSQPGQDIAFQTRPDIFGMPFTPALLPVGVSAVGDSAKAMLHPLPLCLLRPLPLGHGVGTLGQHRPRLLMSLPGIGQQDIGILTSRH